MKISKILTVLTLFCISNIAQPYTISGIIKGNAAVPSCQAFYVTFYDNAHDTIYYDTATFNAPDGKEYNLIVLSGSKGKLEINKPGFYFNPTEKIFNDFIHGDSTQNFIAFDTICPQIDSLNSISDSIILNTIDTIKYLLNDNSDFTRENWAYILTDTLIEIKHSMNHPNNHLIKIPFHFTKIGSYKIRIKAIDADSNTTEDTSNYFYVIDTVSPNLTITSPNGSEKWKVGTNQNVTWDADDNVSIISRAIYYTYDNQNWNLIDSSINIGTYSWLVPNPPSTQCKIRITVYDQSGNSKTDYSDNVFEIIDSTTPDTIPPDVSILYPQQNEKIQKNISYTIKWNASDNDTIIQTILTYSYDSLNWISITLLNSNQDSLLWTIPDTSHICYIKIKVKDSSENENETVSRFIIEDYIAPTVNIISPTSDSMITAGLFITVKFNATDNENKITNYKAFLSTDSGVTYILVKEQPWSGGSKTVLIPTNPSYISEKCLIQLQVIDASNNSGYDTSDIFSIVSPVHVTVQNNTPKKFEIKISNRNFIICMEKTAPVNISILTLNGRTVFNRCETLSTGYHSIPRNYAKGTYILRIKREDKIITKKVF